MRRLSIVTAIALSALVSSCRVVDAATPVDLGGLGCSATGGDDKMLVGNGLKCFQEKSIPSCIGAQDALVYNATTNTLSCVTHAAGHAFQVNGAGLADQPIVNFAGPASVLVCASSGGKITCTWTAIANVVEDLTPSLGGPLDINGKNLIIGAVTIAPGELAFLDGLTAAIQTQINGTEEELHCAEHASADLECVGGGETLGFKEGSVGINELLGACVSIFPSTPKIMQWGLSGLPSCVDYVPGSGGGGTVTGLVGDSGGATSGATPTVAGAAGIVTSVVGGVVGVRTESKEPGFMSNGVTSHLVCGAGLCGKWQQMSDGSFQYCGCDSNNTRFQGFPYTPDNQSLEMSASGIAQLKRDGPTITQGPNGIRVGEQSIGPQQLQPSLTAFPINSQVLKTIGDQVQWAPENEGNMIAPTAEADDILVCPAGDCTNPRAGPGQMTTAGEFISPDTGRNYIGSRDNAFGGTVTCTTETEEGEIKIIDTNTVEGTVQYDLCYSGALLFRFVATGADVIADNEVLVGTSANAGSYIAIPVCNPTTQKLHFDGTAFSCQTDNIGSL